ncbi:nuclear transport factor 2 family protein [Marinimicrobium alkaliphilum]|uniref:nuclear transport factor 2 family protein n=1 Tax=Marinimicrobium alkaliphilum TaxID=2202654 RepID=UPI0013007EB9|nr:nuclear transport factor 2 family protein [Marinimicrobium alkaliphilum]
MKKSAIAIVFSMVSSVVYAAECLEPQALKRLDQQYEQALRTGDPTFMAQLLAEDFVWVHNLVSSTEDKATLVGRLGEGHRAPLARRSEDVKYRRLDNTAVLSGFTTVEQAARTEGGPVRGNKYHFMRTYVAVDGECQLLANQTMKVWSSEEEVQ